MSHWKKISVDMECSIEVLKRILINIMPSWENVIKVDSEGKLACRARSPLPLGRG